MAAMLSGASSANAQCSLGSVRCFGLGPQDPLALGAIVLLFFALGGALAVWIGLERLFPDRQPKWGRLLQITWLALRSPVSDAAGRTLVALGTTIFLASMIALVAIALLLHAA